MGRLRNLVITATALTVLATPVICAAAYAIALKNGRIYYTTAYWHAGSKIMFHAYGGMMGLDTNLVQEIKEVDDSKLDEFVSPSPRTNNNDNQDTEDPSANSDQSRTEETREKAAKDDEKNQAQKDKNIADMAYYRKKKSELKQALEQALETFRHASATHDAAAKKQALADMTALSQQTFALGDELKEKNGGVLPDWWEKE
jgi:hypothetical protein